ncbi:MAG: DUF2125 domain-containing protein, partial [Sphingomonadales bacterium]
MKLKPLFLILLGGALLYSGYWFYLSQSAPKRLTRITTTLEEKGIYLTYEDIEVSGFPYRLIVSFKNPKITLREVFIDFNWNGGKLSVYFQPWNLTHMIFSGLGGIAHFGKNLKIKNQKTISPESFRASFITALGAEQRMSLEILNTIYQNGNPDSPSLNFEKVYLHGKLSNGQDKARLDLFEPKIGDLLFKIEGMSRVGEIPKIIKNNLNISFSPRGKNIPKLTSLGLSLWRDQGSTIDINTFSMNWNGGQITGNGSLTLDGKLRPLGVLSGKYLNPNKIMELLSLTGFITNHEIGSITIGLQTMSSLFEGNTNESTPYSISAQEGGLWLGA